MAANNSDTGLSDATSQVAEDAMPKAETRALWSDVALRTVTRVMRNGALDAVLGKVMTPQARAQVKPNSLGMSLISMAAARIATRSVPGALFVGGGLLAKALYDRNSKRKADADTKTVDPDQVSDADDR